MKIQVTINLPSWLRSKVFWTAFITILIMALNQAITSNLFPVATPYITWAVGILGGILTVVGGVVNSNRVTQLKVENDILKHPKG